MSSFFSFLRSLPSTAKSQRRAGRLRLSAYFGAIALISGSVAWSRAKAEVGNQAMAIGQDLLPLLELIDHPQKIVLNGESIFVATGVADVPLKESLDRVEKVCATDNGSVFRDALQQAPKEVSALGILPSGALRRDTDSSGVVACIAKSAGQSANFLDVIRAFESNTDLGELGKLRYSYMKKTKNGGTHALTVWTEEHFRVGAFAIEDGGPDAPGTDPTLVPRPADSQRFLSAEFEGTPYGVWIYSSTRPAQELADFYDRKLHDEGWFTLNVDQDGNRGRGYEKEGVELILNIGTDADTKKTVVSIAELGMDQKAARAQPH